jgi:simple sugar transport system permease protein
VCFRSNVWNIGAEGQFVIGAICAGGMALLADKDTGRWIVLAILLAGVLGGMLWAGITALLRDRFNASEILVSLMLVYVAVQVLNYWSSALEGPGGLQLPADKHLRGRHAIPRLMAGSRVNIGALIGLAGAALLWLSCSHRAALPCRWAGWRRRRRATPASRRAARCGRRC